MLYIYNPEKGDTVVQVNSVTDFHNFDTIITNNVSIELENGWFLTAKEAMESLKQVKEPLNVRNKKTNNR